MKKKYLIDNKDLMKEWNYEKNNELNIYPNEYTEGSSKKVWWICKENHQWEAVIHTRTKGIRCPYCAGKKAIKGKNDFATAHPDMLKEWDYEKNNQLGIKPDEISLGSQRKVNWVCSKGHKYEKSIYDKLNGRGNCPYCGNRKILQGFNDFATTNSGLLKEWDYEKNNELGILPENITKSYGKKVHWKCDKGHEWKAVVYSRIAGSGCPYCAGLKVLKGYNDIATTNSELLQEWDYEKNNKLGITPFEVSRGSIKKVWWKCEKGHSYNTSIAQKAIKKVGCAICSNQRVLKGYNDFATIHPLLMKEWDYEENNKKGIIPDKIVKGGKFKVSWKCEKGHKWTTSIPSRIRPNGYNRCPICSSYRRVSYPEKVIYYYVRKCFLMLRTILNLSG